MGPKKVPFIITHDARTIRYPDPHIKANDTIRLDIATGKIEEHIKFDTGRASHLFLRLLQ
jgi:small subunit ribosomal protein S4e